MKVKSESEVASVVSDSVRPQRQQPTRLLCPWDFPGESTEVGCHCLLWLPVSIFIFSYFLLNDVTSLGRLTFSYMEWLLILLNRPQVLMPFSFMFWDKDTRKSVYDHKLFDAEILNLITRTPLKNAKYTISSYISETLSCCLVAKLCTTFVTEWTAGRQAPLSVGFPRQEHWSGLPFPPPGDLPGRKSREGSSRGSSNQGLNPYLLHWQADSLLLSHQTRWWKFLKEMLWNIRLARTTERHYMLLMLWSAAVHGNENVWLLAFSVVYSTLFF